LKLDLLNCFVPGDDLSNENFFFIAEGFLHLDLMYVTNVSPVIGRRFGQNTFSLQTSNEASQAPGFIVMYNTIVHLLQQILLHFPNPQF
jgi:hypothetical protein